MSVFPYFFTFVVPILAHGTVVPAPSASFAHSLTTLQTSIQSSSQKETPSSSRVPAGTYIIEPLYPTQTNSPTSSRAPAGTYIQDSPSHIPYPTGTGTPYVGYSTQYNFLQPDIQKIWTPANSSHTGRNVTAPSDPAAFYACNYGPHINTYPKPQEWLDFETMWKINELEVIKVESGSRSNNTQILKVAIKKVAAQSKIDPRLILALIMQESTGDANVSCTNNNRDCGLMQIHGGGDLKTGHTVEDMIREGVFGIPTGSQEFPNGWPGFLDLFNLNDPKLQWLYNIASPEWRAGNPFAAAHAYNAGRLTSVMLNVDDGARSVSYANDIASRLLGWNGAKEGCLKSRTCAGLELQARVC